MKLTLGTRGSELARTQSGLVADALRAAGHDVDLVTIRSVLEDSKLAGLNSHF